jgi:hypothetical protein
MPKIPEPGSRQDESEHEEEGEDKAADESEGGRGRRRDRERYRGGEAAAEERGTRARNAEFILTDAGSIEITPGTDEVVLAAALLARLFEGGDTFLVTNAAVAALLSGLRERYERDPAPRRRSALLRHWGRDVERLRAALREEAAAEPVKLDDGEAMPIVTEERSRSMLDRFCPDDPYLPEPRPATARRIR